MDLQEVMAVAAAVETEDLTALRESVLGRVIVEGEPDYDELRTAWNGMFDRKPALIVQCTGVADVQRVLAFAHDQDLPICVRGGGHSMSGQSTIEGGVLLDLSPLSYVRVDPEREIAYVGGGTRWAQFDRETQVHGLAGTGGMVSTTGVAGLALGGGVGRFMRKYGLTCDNVSGMDIVTADGEWHHVDAEHHPDLYWALRGGGGEFGVVTQFEIELHPLGPMVHGGYLVWELTRAPEVFSALRDLIAAAPEELHVQFVTTVAPPLPFFSEEVIGTPILMLALTWMGDIVDGERELRPFRDAVEPLVDVVDAYPYTVLQKVADMLAPPHRRNYLKSGYLKDLTDEAVDIFKRLAEEFPTELSLIELYQLGGAVNRVPADDTPFSVRDAGFFYTVLATWIDEADDELCLRWTREVDDAFAHLRMPGRYINFLPENTDEDVRDALGDATLERLATVKERYDPTGVFSRDPGARAAG